MPEKQVKPIALIADSVLNGVTWAHHNLHDIQEIAAYRRFIATTSQDYIICTEIRHMTGIEFSDYRVVAGHAIPQDEILSMIEYVRSRMHG